MTTYKFTLEEAQLELKTHTQQEIAKKWGFASHSGFNRRYNRMKQDALQGLKTENTKNKNRAVPIEKKKSTPPVQHPTHFISTLDHDEWIIKYCGYVWKKPYLTILRELIWNSPKLLVLLPRGHGKTLSMIGLFVRHILEIRTPVLVFCSGSNKGDIFTEVKAILESEEIIQDYGVRIRSTNATTGEIFMRTEFRTHDSIDPDFKVVGQLGKSIGKHSGWIHLEDVVQDTKVSDDAEKNVYRWLDRVVKFMKKRSSITKFTATGTRKAPKDFYEYLITKHHMKTHHERALSLVGGRFPDERDVIADHDNEFIELIDPRIGRYSSLDCPEWPLVALLYDYIFHYSDFEAEMQNNPLPALGLYFTDWDGLLVEDIDLSIAVRNCFISIDPAFGKSTQADYFALVVGTVLQGQLYIIRQELKQGLTLTQQKLLITHYVNYLQPIAVYLDATFHQIWLAQELDTIPSLVAVKLQAQKEMRIDALDIPFTQGLLKICRGAGYLNLAQEQFLSYDRKPSTAIKKDDWLDAVALLYEYTKHYLRSGGLYISTWTSRR